MEINFNNAKSIVESDLEVKSIHFHLRLLLEHNSKEYEGQRQNKNQLQQEALLFSSKIKQINDSIQKYSQTINSLHESLIVLNKEKSKLDEMISKNTKPFIKSIYDNIMFRLNKGQNLDRIKREINLFKEEIEHESFRLNKYENKIISLKNYVNELELNKADCIKKLKDIEQLEHNIKEIENYLRIIKDIE